MSAATARGQSRRGLGARLRGNDDERAELLLGAVAFVVLALCGGMIVFVFIEAWPSFSANGLGWFGTGNPDSQLEDIFRSPGNPDQYVYKIGVWPLIWGTFLTSGLATIFALVFSIFASIFMPLSFIVGFFGQNFEYLGGLLNFEVMLAMIVLLPVAMIFWYRRKNWF